jgi:hypothetical protein
MGTNIRRNRSTMYKVIILFIMMGGGIFHYQHVRAQEGIKKEIIVVQPYKPALSDAHKINVLPTISDTISIRPDFDYSIRLRKIETGFEVRTINAANLVGEPLEKLYKSYLKLGAGNYLAPLAALNVNTLRSKNNSMGMFFMHQSVNGKIKLNNGEKVHPGFNDNTLNFYGKKIFSRSVLSGDLDAQYRGINFYGYNPGLDTTLEKESVQQHYFFASAVLQLHSAHRDSSHLNYKVDFDYGYSMDKYEHNEHAFKLAGRFNKLINKQVFGLNADVAPYLSSPSIDSSNQTVLNVNPWFSRSTSDYSYMLGVNIAADIRDGDAKVPLHPRAYLKIKVVDKVFVPYFGIDGMYEVNHFSKMIGENNYLLPGLNTKSTNHKIMGYLGVKGSLSSKFGYHIKFNYSLIDDMYFFVNDTSGVLENQFGMVYDDIEHLNLTGEASFRPGDKLSLLLTARYSRFNMDTLPHPWHTPNFDMSLHAGYNIRNKILLDASLFVKGKRYAFNPDPVGEPVVLEGYLDLNVGIEYRYTKILSAFIRLNNILGMNQEPWLYYPTMRFNAMAGFTYAL